MKRKNVVDILLAISPLAVLILFLFVSISIFHNDTLAGASQVSLLFAAAYCVTIGIAHFKVKWQAVEDRIGYNIGKIASCILILMFIGALSGVWMLSGTVPLLIYYGLQVINPTYFLVSACLICALVSVLTGSSWTTIATIGVALMGIGSAQGFSGGMVAGAIISGAYFGDKISPLSDTTVMASSITDTPLFVHIRYMMQTTIPTLAVTLIIFTVLGFTSHTGACDQVQGYISALQGSFNLSPWLLLVPVITFTMIYLKRPALIVLFLATLLGVVFALVFQPDVLIRISGVEGSTFSRLAEGVIRGIYDTTQLDTGNAEVNDLVATRGIRGMLDTIWLILCAITFGSCMEACGMIGRITSAIKYLVRNRTQLVAATAFTGVVLNVVSADQYMSILINGSVFKSIYHKMGFENRLLSRSIEDSTTVTSVLIPWNTCGMTQATILNVSTLAYLPYCFFNLLSPLMTVLFAALGINIRRTAKGSDKA